MIKKIIFLLRLYFGTLKWTLFICFIIMSVIPATITAYLLYGRSYEAIEAKIGVYSHQIMVQSAGRLDGLLTGIEDIALQIISSNEIQALLDEVNNSNNSPRPEAKEKIKKRTK
ncbi:hypothetical protein V7147_23485 [Bacillus sp. JJ1521]|uniref:hypothetical protein n=1 Tax=Bacillus sp. JJ1521 TaxID=3122957 RepID=UPI002FFF264A